MVASGVGGAEVVPGLGREEPRLISDVYHECRRYARRHACCMFALSDLEARQRGGIGTFSGAYFVFSLYIICPFNRCSLTV